MHLSSEPVLNINGLSAGYGNEDILTDINLQIFPRDYIGLIGPNGGGKTTLLKVILGIISPRVGTIQILGQDAHKGRKYIGYVPQFVETDRDFPISVWDTVRMGLLDGFHMFDKLTAIQSGRICESLEQVGMMEHRKKAMGQLSGGQRQRVFIARALVTDPTLLLLDEPTASIDPNTTREIYNLFHKLNEQLAILLVSHDMMAITSSTKTVACLNRHLVYHNNRELSQEILEKVYGCPIDLIAHGVPHRVYPVHPVIKYG